MRFFTEDPSQAVVRWYFVPPGTPFIGVPSPFGSAIWDTEHLGYNGLGEVYDAPRQYVRGARVGDALGTNHCGTADQWLQGQPVPPEPPTPVDARNTPLCCNRATAIAEPADVRLDQPCVLWWLATCERATYYNSLPLFQSCVWANLPIGTECAVTPNTADLPPGLGWVRLARGGILFVSGTSNLGQWMEQLLYGVLVATDFPSPTGPETGKTLNFWVAIANFLNGVVNLLLPNDEPVLLVGHSMGGAAAELLRHRWELTNTRAGSRCFTIGAPKLGNQELVDRMGTAPRDWQRWCTDTDPVPQLPPNPLILPFPLPPPFGGSGPAWASMRQPGSQTNVFPDGSTAVGPGLPLGPFLWLAVAAAAADRPVPIYRSHAIGTYVRYIGNACPVLPTPLISGWTDPSALVRINASLDNPEVGVGGLDLGGEAVFVLHSEIPGEGGLEVNGTAPIATPAVITGEGGLEVNGTAPIGAGAVIIGEGGLAVAGHPDLLWSWFTAVLQAQSFASVSTAVGEVPWGNPGNAQAVDGVYATAGMTSGNPHSEQLQCVDLSAPLTGAEKIDGVEVYITRARAGLRPVADLSVTLILAGTPSGSDYASATSWPATDTQVIYGSPTDNWGLALSAADVNDSGFGAQLQVQKTAGVGFGGNARVDAIEFVIYWTLVV